MPTNSFMAAFARKVSNRPDSPALLWEGRRTSYGELQKLVAAVVGRLRDAGLPDASPVCVVGRKSPQLVATVLACFLTGRRVLLPPAELGATVLARLVAQAGCHSVIRVAWPVRQSDSSDDLDIEIMAGIDDRVAASQGQVSDGPVTPGRHEAPALLLTTSGSTGVPKVVPLAPAGVDRFVEWAASRFQIGDGVVVLNYAPLNFDLCLLEVWTSLAHGACVALVGEDHATDGRWLLRLVAAADVVQGVPMLFRLLADAAEAAGKDLPEAPARVREVLFTGDVMPAGLVGRISRLYPRASLYNVYGCTETNDSFLHEFDAADVPHDAPLPIGQPLPGVSAVVVDPSGAVLAGEAVGELVVRTPFQCDGYLDPLLDQDRFVPAPPGLGGGRYYRTGDLVRRDAAGAMTLLGRTDFQIKVRGVRTNLQDIEAVILRHSEVAEAVVVALPDELAGHRLHAVVRRVAGTALDGLQLRRHCAGLLSRTAIPGRVEVIDEPLPRTSTGKVDRGLIRRSRMEGK